MTPLFRFHLPALLWTAALAVLLLVPGPQGPVGDWGWLRVPDYSDKALHALLFGFAAWLFHRSLGALARRPSRRALLAAVALAVLYGAMLEAFQGIPVLRRDPDLWDLVANTCGACLYAALAMTRWRRSAAAAEPVPAAALRPPALDGKMGES